MTVAVISRNSISNAFSSTPKFRKPPGFFTEPGGESSFDLGDSFLRRYADKKPDFGYNGLGEFVFYRTYSRLKADQKTKESFLDVITRVVTGTYEIQRRHCQKQHISWDVLKARDSAQEMFELMWDFKFLPPGRGLWTMGIDFMWTRGGACLNNCGFVSTEDITVEPAEPFCFLMDMSMLGVGIGFDTRGADKLQVIKPNRVIQPHVIDDSREGWVHSLRLLLNSYLKHPEIGILEFDYSKIRKAGEPIKGFGGTASGPEVLARMHDVMRPYLDNLHGKPLSSVAITDIQNMAGACIVAGNVRRSAEIALGAYDDGAYSEMKNVKKGLTTGEGITFDVVTGEIYKRLQDSGSKEIATTDEVNFKGIQDELRNRGTPTFDIRPEALRAAIYAWNSCNTHRWASNNSILAKVGMDYTAHAENTGENGEPGYVWLENMRDFGRMKDGRRPGCDHRVMGTNPCAEQSLESYELCCLAETFPSKHKSVEEYHRTLKYSYLYAKTVTLLPTHNSRTNSVMQRNRRIGLSQSGIVAGFQKFGRNSMLRDFCDAGYDEIKRWDAIYSEWLCICQSNKITSVKPSGTVSLVAGVPPGIHFPEAKAYWRHVRVAWTSPLIKACLEAGYYIETDVRDKETAVVRFGIDESDLPSIEDVNVYTQMNNVADYQYYWCDNQPSVTIKFKPSEKHLLKELLETYDRQLKTVSFLPHFGHGYVQAPYVPCKPEEVREYNANLKQIDFSKFIQEDATGSNFCDGEACSTGL